MELLIGSKIKAVRKMTEKEMDEQGWGSAAIVIELDNGVKLFPSSDGEGNDAGVLFGTDPTDGGQFALY